MPHAARRLPSWLIFDVSPKDQKPMRIPKITSVLMRRAQRLYVDIPPELGLGADLFALAGNSIDPLSSHCG